MSYRSDYPAMALVTELSDVDQTQTRRMWRGQREPRRGPLGLLESDFWRGRLGQGEMLSHTRYGDQS